MEEKKENEKKKLIEVLKTEKGKKVLKRIIIGVVIIFLIIFVNINNYSEFKRISKYVNKDYKELTTIANSYLNGEEVEPPEYVEEVTIYKEDNIVEFTTSGRGVSTYYGFYYSKNNKEVSYQNEYELLGIGKDKWMWSTEKGDEGKTFKIRDNFYYFEASL